MLVITDYTVSHNLLQEAVENLPVIDQRLALNQPTGKFFNNPWTVKPEYSGTVWESLLDSLPKDKGEARLIKLEPGEAYPSHADIDDRWHLNLTGNHCYLIDLEQERMHPIELGKWYSMDAGIKHTAANFGSETRIQLVVRKLLPLPDIHKPVDIVITLKEIVGDRRFIFDDIISPWLNRAYKLGIVDNFHGEDLVASFTVEADYVPELQTLVSDYFNLTIKN